ncbi:MAG: hypothetical protein Fues2KO_13360 [Fuerstiella sp.]
MNEVQDADDRGTTSARYSSPAVDCPLKRQRERTSAGEETRPERSKFFFRRSIVISRPPLFVELLRVPV